jgi:hypothetical protein
MELSGRVKQKLNVVPEHFPVYCCGREVEFSRQFARLMQNQVHDLVDSSCFSPLEFVIRKSAVLILSQGKAMNYVVKVNRCRGRQKVHPIVRGGFQRQVMIIALLIKARLPQ